VKYVEQFLAYKKARTEADKVLLPDELFEVDNALRDLEARVKHSQTDLDEMLDKAPVKKFYFVTSLRSKVQLKL